MSKYIIDTEAGTCQPYGTPIAYNIVDFLRQYEGAKEYGGIVGTIQTWYYGSLIRAPWCATCMSWVFSKLGIPVDKAENVYTLMRNCQYAATQGHGTFFSRSELPPELNRGDVCFLLFSGTTMTTTSSKHVTAYIKDAGANSIHCIGGNQSDGIFTKTYNRSSLYAVYRP